MSRHFGGIQPGRQSDKTRTVLFASLFFVVLFTVLAFVLLSTGHSKTAPKPVLVETEAEIKMVDVLVPVKEIKAGEALEARMFRKESRPAVGVGNRVVKDFEEIRNFYSRSLIVSGQPLHRDYITAVKPTSAVTAKIMASRPIQERSLYVKKAKKELHLTGLAFNLGDASIRHLIRSRYRTTSSAVVYPFYSGFVVISRCLASILGGSVHHSRRS